MIPADEMFEKRAKNQTPLTQTRTHTQSSPTPNGVVLDSIEDAIEAMRAGHSVVVVDDEDRENEGDLIFAANAATPELTGFMIRHTSGYICVGMTGQILDRLGLPPMTSVNETPSIVMEPFSAT